MEVLVIVAVCALAIAVIRSVIRIALYVPEALDDAYATWAAGDLLLANMDDHDGKWPGSWEDCAESHE